jgi:hypothetical protein
MTQLELETAPLSASTVAWLKASWQVKYDE